MKRYLEAQLADGTRVIGEFRRLAKVGRYVAAVMGGYRPFEVWQVVGETHPASGEKCLVRTRQSISGRSITSIREVKPRADLDGPHNSVPTNFEPVARVQRGPFGLFTVTEGLGVEGAQVGVEYPVHRDPTSLRKFIIVRAQDEAAGTTELRYYIDGRGEAPTNLGVATMDDDGARVVGSLSQDDDDEEDDDSGVEADFDDDDDDGQ